MSNGFFQLAEPLGARHQIPQKRFLSVPNAGGVLGLVEAGHHAEYGYEQAPRPVYDVLLRLVKGKNHFILATSVDRQF